MNETKTTYLRDYKPPAFLIKTVDLCFTLQEASTRVNSVLTITRNPDAVTQTEVLALNGQHLELLSVKLNHRPLLASEYRLTETTLIIPGVPEEFTLHIETQIKPDTNTSLSGLYVSRNIFCTQCEAEGFRRISYFIDRPDILSSYTTTLIADKTRYPVLLSNGNKIATKILANNQHSVTWQDPFKKPSYLFALVAGDLEHIEDYFITQSGRKVILQIFFEKGQAQKCHHAMDSLKKAMAWDQQAYAREYDLDIFMIVVIDDFNMGAMENKGLNIFNAQTILADPQSATDADYCYVSKVVGHEYFHNWTGNRITCRDWFQLSLKEGLTVFREQEFSESIGSAAIERINTVKLLRSLQFAEDAGPLAHPVQPDSYIEINNFYTMTIYEKGAEIIRMLKVLVGPELFRKGMDIYFQRHDGQAVTIEEFIQAIEAGSAYDLQQFRLWYKQSGTPEVHVHYSYNERENTFDLVVKQHCPPTPHQASKKNFYFPLSIALLGAAGQTLPLQLIGEPANLDKQRILTIKRAEEHFQFLNIAEKPVPSLLRNFSAPVKLYTDYSDDDLAFLMQNDTDDFNRWDAAQQLISRIVTHRLTGSLAPNRAIDLLIESYQRLLSHVTQDNNALFAELLTLPSETYFAEQMQIIDVDAIHAARIELRQKIASALFEQLLALYQRYQDFKPYAYKEQAQGQRRLKNTCLSYLMLSKDMGINKLCMTHYQKADNMTDRVSALGEIVNNALPEQREFLNDFYENYKTNPLIVCKWFAVQARVPVNDALQRVKCLLEHPAFDWKNPNKIRSLIGIFCSENLVQFHQRSGEGYVFLREKIQYLDRLNPQIAARLLRPLTRWKRFDNTRREMMRQELEQIARASAISPDVYEIVSKSLLE